MYYGRCENGLLHDLTVNYLLLLSLIYSSISFCYSLLVFACLFIVLFQLSLLFLLLCDTFGESIGCVNAPFVEQNAVYSTTKVTK